jgi:hypothetical protein
MPQTDNLSSIRGHGVILCTCDSNRGREATKEAINLLTEILDEYDELKRSGSKAIQSKIDSKSLDQDNLDYYENDGSIEDSLDKEIKKAQMQSKCKQQAVVSMNTGMKGLVIVKINRKDITASELVYRIFEKIKFDSVPRSRYIVRLVPWDKTFFPNQESMEANVHEIVREIKHELGILTPNWDDFNACDAIKVMNNDMTHKLRQDDRDNDAEFDEEVSSKRQRTDETARYTPFFYEKKKEVNCKDIDNTDNHISIAVAFKRRNHNVLSREDVQHYVYKLCTFAQVDYKTPKVILITIA